MPHIFRFSVVFLASAIAASVASGLYAQPAIADEGLGCPVDTSTREQLAAEIGKLALESDQVLHVTADRIESLQDEIVILTGSVVIIRGDRRIRTERAIYRKNENTVEVPGHVQIDSLSGGSFSSEKGFLNLSDETGFAELGRFNLQISRGRGYARRIVFVSKGRIKLKIARFTTCDPSSEDWYLKAREIDIDQNTATGKARHASLHLKGLPIFYTPYISFPLGDQRRSGFLLPDFGSTDKMGTYVTVPYYWNIAPNYDATLKPRYMSNRGMQLQTEFRYLGRKFNGIAEVETLPYDTATGTARNGLAYQHHHRFGPRLTADADINWVSDISYFDDFATQLSTSSQTHLPQTIQINYRRQDWRLAASASNYQTIDKTIASSAYPYARLPQLTADWRPGLHNKAVNYRFRASATDFQHDVKETARRLHLQPSLFYPVRKPYGFIEPRLSAYYTGYINRSAGTDGAIATAVASMDAGLFFERPLSLRQQPLIQTLEPRLFYIYSPYVDQDSLPVFDTSVPGFSFSSLFQENRFIGSDRVGDTHQLTLALTSRLIDDRSGSERLSASIGQTFYFADRQVNLPVGTTTDARSDIAAELSAWLGSHWYARSSVQWDPQANTPNANNHFLQYQPDKKHIVNLGYRYTTGMQELVDISTQWPLTGKWTLLARSQYSIRDRQNQDSYAGVLYDTCCWSLRTLVGRRVDQDGVQVNSFVFQLLFKGLAGFDSGIASGLPMEQSVFD
jgi:LPS-assembly protein